MLLRRRARFLCSSFGFKRHTLRSGFDGRQYFLFASGSGVRDVGSCSFSSRRWRLYFAECGRGWGFQRMRNYRRGSGKLYGVRFGDNVIGRNISIAGHFDSPRNVFWSAQRLIRFTSN